MYLAVVGSLVADSLQFQPLMRALAKVLIFSFSGEVGFLNRNLARVCK